MKNLLKFPGDFTENSFILNSREESLELVENWMKSRGEFILKFTQQILRLQITKVVPVLESSQCAESKFPIYFNIYFSNLSG